MQNKTETKKTRGAATQLSRMAMKLQFPLFPFERSFFQKTPQTSNHDLKGPLTSSLKNAKCLAINVKNFTFNQRT